MFLLESETRKWVFFGGPDNLIISSSIIKVINLVRMLMYHCIEILL